MEWDSSLYDEKHGFVAAYGKDLFELIPDNKAQTILDLGCGTGILTAQLSRLGGRVMGVDSSSNMIDKARKQYGGIEFGVCDALDLPFEKEWDVVFSNAVFHWIGDHNTLLQNIHKALKPHGLLICEFGADGNIATIENAFLKAYKESGYNYRPKFNFPTAEHFGKLLEKNGFVVDQLYAYDRPTVLKDAEQGLENWIKQFFASELEGVPEGLQDVILKRVGTLTRSALWNGEAWIADYRRLRAAAHIE